MNPDDIARLLRALASTPSAQAMKHDVILCAAADIVEQSKLARPIPCDVWLPPNTLIRKGAPLQLVLSAMLQRVQYEEQYTRFDMGPN